MNFLNAFIDSINNSILKLLEKLKSHIPPFVFHAIEYVKHLPELIKKKLKILGPKLNIYKLKFIGYSEHYITMAKGYFVGFMIYLRSEEFKKAKKAELLKVPFIYAKNNPLKTLSTLASMAILLGATSIIFKNTEKIIIGTKSLRKPASAELEEENFIEFKKFKFELHASSGAGGGGGHGAASAGEAHELILYSDIKIIGKDRQAKDLLEAKEHDLEQAIEKMHLEVHGLPLTTEEQTAVEQKISAEITKLLYPHQEVSDLIKVELKQLPAARPVYYRQLERMFSVEDSSFQIFLEDTHRNRQVMINFSVLMGNRNSVLYLKDHIVELKDHLTTNVEPILPQLPIEEEGRQIIKDKIREEINNFLKKSEVEGKVQEVYIDYLMAS